jgi:hypothetical protein
MSRMVLLDSGPLGLVTGPHSNPSVLQCQQWLANLLRARVAVLVPEIADYEVRRELLRARKRNGVPRLDNLKAQLGYVPLTTATMLQAAAFWAQVRQQGQPTAASAALDGDVILAAQAALLIASGHSVVVATTNVGHLARLVPAEEWPKISA